jgi:hypothetical protein
LLDIIPDTAAVKTQFVSLLNDPLVEDVDSTLARSIEKMDMFPLEAPMLGGHAPKTGYSVHNIYSHRITPYDMLQALKQVDELDVTGYRDCKTVTGVIKLMYADFVGDETHSTLPPFRALPFAVSAIRMRLHPKKENRTRASYMIDSLDENATGKETFISLSTYFATFDHRINDLPYRAFGSHCGIDPYVFLPCMTDALDEEVRECLDPRDMNVWLDLEDCTPLYWSISTHCDYVKSARVFVQTIMFVMYRMNIGTPYFLPLEMWLAVLGYIRVRALV